MRKSLKNLMLCAVAMSTLIGAVANAADVAIVPASRSVWSWTGCYLGGHVGGGIAQIDWSVDPSDRGSGIGGTPLGSTLGRFGGPADLGTQVVPGFLGGGQVGCDYQFANRVVAGLQTDVSWTNMRGSSSNTAVYLSQPFFGNLPLQRVFAAQTTVTAFGTMTGRLGYASDRALFYVKGGAAWIRDRYAISAAQTVQGLLNGAFNASAKNTRWGWTVGSGFEYALSPNLSALIEYNYLDFGSATANFNCVTNPVTGNSCGFNGALLTNVPVDVRQQIHAIKVGLNYRFWSR